MKRLLIFHFHDTAGNESLMLPAYYIEADYDPVAVRIHAETAPTRDATFNIYDDGVSIFSEQGSQSVDRTTGVITTLGSGTQITLAAKQNSEESAESFNENLIETGSWITCKLINAGGGKNFTVQLELRQASEDEDSED